jgi:site-specific DNA-methyltransferase (adenine-specific)
MEAQERESRVRAPLNRTISLSDEERELLRKQLVKLDGPIGVRAIQNNVIHQDLSEALPYFPDAFVDLLFLDPPYNQYKTFADAKFRAMSNDVYAEWIDSWLSPMVRLLKPTASIYFCANWQSSQSVQRILGKHFVIRNRITWEREKGRGAQANWKNASEDIWFCTMSDDYYFDTEAVKLKRRVVAPYTSNGVPKDWSETEAGNFRLTHASNLWTDLTVPFWSMTENTDHPTQKPEKLLAKVLLASSRLDDVIFDPFLGSGTSAAVAKKLGRKFVGIEIDEEFCLLALKRIALAEMDASIQGYTDGVFWERNALSTRTNASGRTKTSSREKSKRIIQSPELKDDGDEDKV